MRWTLALIAAAATFPRLARASDTGIRVERGPGTETCPDESTLSRAIEAVRGRSHEARAPSAYHVSFSRTDSAFEARIESLRDRTARSLSDASGTCDALARAAAVTLALLLDADAASDDGVSDDARDSASNDAAARSAADIRAEALAPPHHRSRAGGARAITAYAGGGALLLAIRPAAPLLTGGAGLELRAFSASIGAAWATPGAVDLAPGNVSTSLLAINLESCVSLIRASATRMDLCSGLLAGFVSAEAHGYTRNEARSRTWLAIPAGLGVGVDLSALRLGLNASVLVPVRRQEFRVDGVGLAYETPPVGAMLSLRAIARLPF